MRVGNIVVIKGLNLMGEVLEIDDLDMATLSLCENNTHIKVAISDLEVTEAVQPHRESGKSVSILGTQYKILIIPEGITGIKEMLMVGVIVALKNYSFLISNRT